MGHHARGWGPRPAGDPWSLTASGLPQARPEHGQVKPRTKHGRPICLFFWASMEKINRDRVVGPYRGQSS